MVMGVLAYEMKVDKERCTFTCTDAASNATGGSSSEETRQDYEDLQPIRY